jgi:hypothetical protein
VIQGGQIPDIVSQSKQTVIRTDSFIEYEYVPYPVYTTSPVDTAAIIADFDKSRYYKDTSHLKGAIVGYEAIVKRNKLEKIRQFADSIESQVITNTIVQKVPEKKNQVYLGFNIQGNRSELLTGAGPSILFKTKADKMIELGALYGHSRSVIVQAGVKLKLF